MGTEFLCCMTQYRGQQTHIYIREIRTGFGSNNVLWVDDELLPNPGHGLNENQKLLHYIYYQSFQKNVNFILKTSSKLAWSYINSEFFKKSLEVCNSFKLVSDVTRFNEDGDNEAKWNAGPIFIKKFIQQTATYQNIDKVETMVFCGDKNSAIRKFQANGFQQDRIPVLTNDPNQFVSFVSKNSMPVNMPSRFQNQSVPRESLPSTNKKDYKNRDQAAKGYEQAL